MFSFYEQLTFIKWDKFLVVVVVSVTGLFMKNRNPFLIPINPASTKKVTIHLKFPCQGEASLDNNFVLGSHLNLQKWFLLCFTSYFISTLRLLEQFTCTCMWSNKCYFILEYSRKDFYQIIHIWAWIFFLSLWVCGNDTIVWSLSLTLNIVCKNICYKKRCAL